jgi:hypothetical protein
MDKITFESVMEEIKKSLGEARLMDIEEAMSFDEAENPASRAARLARQAAAQAAAAHENKAVDDKVNPQLNVVQRAARAVGIQTPDMRDTENKAREEVRSSTTAPAPAAAPATAARPAPAPAPAAAPATAARPAPAATSSRREASAEDLYKTPGSDANDPSKAAASPTSPPSTPKAPSVSAPAATRSQGVTNQPPKSQGVTNQPATSSDNKYGYAKSGSDDDTAANFFRADAARMKDQGKKAPNDFSEAKKMYAENFDQFVKKFLKESR